MTVASALAEGELTFPAPFDLASAAALANNIDDGGIAEKLFDVTAARECSYRVEITEIAGDDRREIVATTVGSQRLLIALLDSFLTELEARRP